MKDSAIESTKGVLQNLIVVASLVHTLTDSLGSASDLYRKLKTKKRKIVDSDYDDEGPRDRRRAPLSRRPRESDSDSEFRDRDRRRSKSRRREREERARSMSRRRDGYDSERDSDEESISASSELVLAEYKRGYHYLGKKFADGDLIAQNQLQAQIITLQQTLLTIYQVYFLNPTPHNHAISQHLAQLLQTTRSTRSASIEALAMQYQRMLEIPETFPLPDLPGTFPSPTSRTHPLIIREKSRTRGRSPDTGSKRISYSKSSSHSTSTVTAPHSLYCIYALDLQKFPSQPLADAYLKDGDGACPFCHFVISTRPSKAWEVVKEDDRRRDEERVFLVEQRFIVKCHREGGRFACVICSKCRETDTVCADARALVDHLWREHTCNELMKDEDIVEVE